MAAKPHRYTEQLIDLLLATADIEDPSWLKRLEDGDEKYRAALVALTPLRKQVEPYRRVRTEADEAERRLREEQARAAQLQATRSKLNELKNLLLTITAEDPQRRGQSLETLLNQLFALFDIDTKSSFRVVGEQIDGAFTHEGTEFLLEARWRAVRAAVKDLDGFSGTIDRKLDNTLGVFLSVNGFEPTAIELFSQNRPRLFLMDGADLSAVVDDRISSPDLLTRKRQHAAHTGEVFIGAYSILS